LTELREHQRETQQGNRDYQASFVQMYTASASHETVDLLQLKLIAGTTLPASRPGDSIMSIVLNRKAVEYLETTPEEIIGTELPVWLDQPVYVCGVVDDFHFRSLHEAVTPYGIHNGNGQYFSHLLLRVNEENLSQKLLAYEEIFKKHFPNDVFEAQFPDLIMAQAYVEDRQTGYMVLSFSFLAILVACMGVFGLTAFMAEQRTKEIGIRKVFGASVGSIVRLFTDSYLRLLALSLIIAIPISWWLANKYLEDFAYRISLAWWMFAAAALITVALTLLTVGWQAIKAATVNPVKAIKSE
jgi:putative ABC transport system permease protein